MLKYKNERVRSEEDLLQAIAVDIGHRLFWRKMKHTVLNRVLCFSRRIPLMFVILVSCVAIGRGGVLFWGCSV